ADQFVDDHALVRIGETPAFPAAALLGGASLVVDQHGDAGDRRKFLLDRDQVVAVMDGEPARPLLALGIFPRLVGGDSHALLAIFRREWVRRTSRCAPWAATARAIGGTVSPPSLGWPPVMATASLNRIL